MEGSDGTYESTEDTSTVVRDGFVTRTCHQFTSQVITQMEDKTKYRKQNYLKNEGKLIEYGEIYYNERINPKVEIEICETDVSKCV